MRSDSRGIEAIPCVASGAVLAFASNKAAEGVFTVFETISYISQIVLLA